MYKNLEKKTTFSLLFFLKKRDWHSPAPIPKYPLTPSKKDDVLM